MLDLTKLKNYLWRPFEIESKRPVETIQDGISKKVIKEMSFQWLPDEKLRGKSTNGHFEISYKPLSSYFMRGAGSLTMRGVIESEGTGSRIYGHLPGPPFAVYLLLAIWIGFCVMLLNQFIREALAHNFVASEQLPLCIVGLIFPGMAVIIFFFDREANKTGEGKILDLLKAIAK